MTEDAQPRVGTVADLSRRVDNLETNVSNLATVVARVELNQVHAEEVNKLRFEALGQAVSGVGTKLDTFMARIEGVLSGEVETNQAREGREMVADYKKWRAEVDRRMATLYTAEQKAKIEERLDAHDAFAVQGKLLGRLGALLVTSNVIAILAAIAAIVKPS